MARILYSSTMLLLIILLTPKAFASANLADYGPSKNDLTNTWSFPTDSSMTSSPELGYFSSPGYPSTDDNYEEYDDDTDSLDPQGGIQLPPPGAGLPPKPAITPHRAPITCAQYDFAKDIKPQSWRKTKAGDWKLRGKHKNKRWRRRMMDEQILCDYSCLVLWEVDSLKPTIAKIKRAGCSNWNCKPDCHQNMTVFNADKLDFACCCSTDNCNAPDVFLPSTSTALETGGLEAADGGRTRDEGPVRKTISTPVNDPTIKGPGTICAFKGKKHRHYYRDGVSSKTPGHDDGGFHMAKRYHPPEEEVESGGLEGIHWPSGLGSTTLGTIISEDKVLCEEDSVCFTLWVPDKDNSSQVHIQVQGCWLKEHMCERETCEATGAPLHEDKRFCCCKSHNCNAQVSDSYDPSKSKQRPLLTTTTKTPVHKAIGPIHDHSYREKMMIVLLVLLPSVSLVLVLSYLVYRLCLTSKRATPPNSAAGTHTDAELVDNGCGPSPSPSLDLGDLKILDLIVRGRYSEVRRGSLYGKDVAVKIYQQHHRQYFFNERSAFTLPFMDNENLVKFYGTAERTMESSGGDSHSSGAALGLGGGDFSVSQYLVVTELAPLGSLTGYLKHNTVDWYQLCHMTQGICAGLVHLHADIKRPDLGLYKPAVAHRDINTRNILVKSDLSCVVADLGFAVGVMGSKVIRNGKPEVAEQCSLADVGTLRYMAPEVIDGAVNLRDCEASLKQIDVYALGLVIWELASRCVDLYQGAPVPDYQLPYQAEAGTHPLFEELQVLVVKHKTRPKFPDVWKDTHLAVRSLMETIQDCWDPDADARLTALCVQERIADMATMWVQSSSRRKREVMPTLNSDLWPQASRMSNSTVIPGVVSNGVAVIPSYVEEISSGPGGINCGSQQCIAETVSNQAEADQVLAERYQSSNCVPNRNFPACDEEVEEDTAVTALLIDSNLNKLTRRGTDESSYETARVREWLQEQSLSESTMDTLLPLTPVSDRNQNLIDCDIEETIFSPSGPSTAAISSSQVAVKANNVLLAEKKAVISHPNQGRNPTAARNTHKRSDEELAVEGNQLVGTLDSRSSGGSETLGPLAKRKGSVDNQSAPPTAHRDAGVMLDGSDGDGEFSSLVGHDLLNDGRIQQHQSRHAPIPFLQNQVHQGNSGSQQAQSVSMRPKLANLKIGTNCNSYSHPNRETNRNSVGGRGCITSYPQCKPPKSGEKELNSSETKSVKNKLAKFIRPKDLGQKFSAMIFGGKKKTVSSGTVNEDELQERSDSGYRSQDLPDDGSGSDQIPCHYDNSGLETSPHSKSSTEQVPPSSGLLVPMQVQLSNGVAVSSTCHIIPNVSVPAGVFSSNRLTNTDVRQGGFQDALFKSPTLFAQSSHHSNIGEIPSITAKNGYLPNGQLNLDSSNVPFQNQAKKNKSYISMKGVTSQAACPNPEIPTQPMHDQNHNTQTHSMTTDNVADAKHQTSSLNTLSENVAKFTDKANSAECHITVPFSSLANVLPNSLPYSQTKDTQCRHENEGDAKSEAASISCYPKPKDGKSFLFNGDTNMSNAIYKSNPIFTKPNLENKSNLIWDSQAHSFKQYPYRCMRQSSNCSEPPKEFSEPQYTAKAKLCKDSHTLQGERKEKVTNSRPTTMSMCHSWHEDSFSEGGGFLRNDRRPKSLSLHGHNYKRLNSAAPEASPSPDLHAELDASQPGDSSHKLPSNLNLTSCQTSKAEPESFQPIKIPEDQLLGQSKLPGKKVGNTKNCAIPSSYSHDHFTANDANLDSMSESNLKRNNRRNKIVRGQDRECDDSENVVLNHKEVKLNRIGFVSSNSSEKIRQRIKTPVSFKVGRLSLYDDRLMSQSLDSAMFYNQAGEEV